jgi:drug/metabolite transporter (DMT)-like permease
MTAKTAFFSGIWLLILFIVLRTMNQIMFKYVALGPGGSNYFALLFDPVFYLAGFVFWAQAIVWIAVLRRMVLSRAYPFTGLTVITLLISGAYFFGDSITLGNVLGALVIVAGVAIIAGGNEE